MTPQPTVPDFLDREDPVAQTLHLLRMTGVVYCRSELTAPWGLDLPPMPGCLMFHIFTSGSGWLVVDGEPPKAMRAGDFALVPHGAGHRLASAPTAIAAPLFDLNREPVSEWFEVLRHGGGGDRSDVICGAVRFDDPVAQHLALSLPRLITIDGLDDPEREWVHSTFRLLSAEAAQHRPGSVTVITRLADVLVIQAIRAWLEAGTHEHTGWLRGLHDRHVGRALAMIHRDLARPWTLEDIASAAGLSRSAFSARFTQLVGLPPMEYLTQWRMRIAHARLKERHMTLGQLAAEVGYESEAAFHRAFKRVTGVTPGAVVRGDGV